MATEFVYPPGGNFSTANDDRYLNVFDDLYIEYTSSYTSLNITLFCLRTTTSTAYQVFNAEDNPLTASGMYHFGSIQSHNVEIYQFPTRCHFKLTDSGDDDDALSGEGFEVSSNAASSTTFSPTSSSTSTSTLTSTSSDIDANAQATMTEAITIIPASTSSSSATDAASDPSTTGSTSSSGLSGMQAFGIGIGLALAVIILVVAWFKGRNRKKRAAAAAKSDSHQPLNDTQGAQEMDTERPAAELENGPNDPSQRHELASPSQRHELASSSNRHELPS